MSLYLAIFLVIALVSHVVIVVLQNRDKTERIYMNASDVPSFKVGDLVENGGTWLDEGLIRKVIHTSVSDSCITVRPLHWWERLLHWLKGLL